MHRAKESLSISFETLLVVGHDQRITTIGRHVFVEAKLQKDGDLPRVVDHPLIKNADAQDLSLDRHQGRIAIDRAFADGSSLKFLMNLLGTKYVSIPGRILVQSRCC